MNKEGTGLCNDCQYRCGQKDCDKKQKNKDAIDPELKLCNLCYKPNEQPKLEIEAKKNYDKFFKCPVKDCGKWKRLDAIKEFKSEKMCAVCFNRISKNNKDKIENDKNIRNKIEEIKK